MTVSERLAGLEATAAALDARGDKLRARAVRQVLVPFSEWVEAEVAGGGKPNVLADTIARVLGSAVENFAAITGLTRAEQLKLLARLFEEIADGALAQHKERHGL
jgi:hypothetical protein